LEVPGTVLADWTAKAIFGILDIGGFGMTATVEIKDSLVKKARKITGITDDTKLVNQVFKNFILGEEAAQALMPLQGSGIWDGGKPKRAK
jgi:uncharacterized NAD-dependent epimerase/dehydratase family protein